MKHSLNTPSTYGVAVDKQEKSSNTRNKLSAKGMERLSDYQIRCAVCGSVADVPASNLDQLQTAKNNGVYVCTGCQAKIRFESEHNRT
jgi:DNA-directed RNA polymerase subunit RPC12/RpoP